MKIRVSSCQNLDSVLPETTRFRYDLIHRKSFESTHNIYCHFPYENF